MRRAFAHLGSPGPRTSPENDAFSAAIGDVSMSSMRRRYLRATRLEILEVPTV
jgi:hypothetical protein